MTHPSITFTATFALCLCFGLGSATLYAATDQTDAESAAGAVDIFAVPDFQKAVAGYNENRFDQARRHLERLLQRFPKNPEILNNLAVIAVKQNDYERAIRLLRAVIATDNTVNTSYYNLSSIYAYLASESYRQALSLESEAPKSLNLKFIDDRREKPPRLQSAVEAILANQQIDKPLVKEPESAFADGRQQPEVVQFINSWAEAWANQDLDAYLRSYARDYKPRRGSYTEWKAQRTRRLRAPSHIDVDVSNIRLKNVSPARVIVTFRQRYRSNLLQSTITKQLELVREQNQWRIADEKVLK